MGADERQALDEKAREVAAALGPGWTVEGDVWDRWRTIRDALSPERALILGVIYGGDRLEIGARRPAGMNGWSSQEHPWPKITVAAGRLAAAIAREIARRVLPAYDAALAEALRVRAAGDARDARADAVLRIMREAMGDEREPEREPERGARREWSVHGPGSLWGRVRTYGDDIGLELEHVPVEMAAKMLRLLVAKADGEVE